MAASIIVDTIEGTVERTNDSGFQLAGHNGWLNLSRYAQPRPDIPSTGQHVVAGLDRGGYVRTIEPAPSAKPPDPAAAEPPSPLAGEGLGMRGEPLEHTEPPDRDTRIMRQAVLNTATAILASGGRATDAKAVLELAAALERWVSR